MRDKSNCRIGFKGCRQFGKALLPVCAATFPRCVQCTGCCFTQLCARKHTDVAGRRRAVPHPYCDSVAAAPFSDRLNRHNICLPRPHRTLTRTSATKHTRSRPERLKPTGGGHGSRALAPPPGTMAAPTLNGPPASRQVKGAQRHAVTLGCRKRRGLPPGCRHAHRPNRACARLSGVAQLV